MPVHLSYSLTKDLSGTESDIRESYSFSCFEGSNCYVICIPLFIIIRKIHFHLHTMR